MNTNKKKTKAPGAKPKTITISDADLIARAVGRVKGSKQSVKTRTWAPIFYSEAEAMIRELDRSPAAPAGGERTCVHCGCTESRACDGGCSWLEVHKATPTGICSSCGPVGGIRIGIITVSKVTAGSIYLHNHAGGGLETAEAKLAKVIEKFFDKEF